MVIPPVTGSGNPPLYLIVTNDGPDGPLVIHTWACEFTVAQAAARRYQGVLYRAELMEDHR